MIRREFVTLLGGAAATWPLAARAQQPERMRRVGMLMPFTADDPEAQARMLAFAQELQHLGWTVGRNLRIDIRWGSRDTDRIRKDVAELVALAPDVILANGSRIVGELQQATRSIPLVFTAVVDPVSAGFVASLARPAGNATGFTDVPDAEPGKRVTGAGPHTESLCRHTPKVGEAMGRRRRLWHLHRPYELMEAAPCRKSMISAEAWPRLIRSRP